MNLIINLTGILNEKKELSPELSKKIYSQRLKINSILENVEKYGLSTEYIYTVRGASDISGCSINSSLNTNNPTKIYVKKAHKKKRFLPNLINEKIRVIDIYTKKA